MKEDAHDQLSEIASSPHHVDPSCVELKQSALLAQLLLEDLGPRVSLRTNFNCSETCAAHAAYLLR